MTIARPTRSLPAAESSAARLRLCRQASRQSLPSPSPSACRLPHRDRRQPPAKVSPAPVVIGVTLIAVTLTVPSGPAATAPSGPSVATTVLPSLLPGPDRRRGVAGGKPEMAGEVGGLMLIDDEHRDVGDFLRRQRKERRDGEHDAGSGRCGRRATFRFSANGTSICRRSVSPLAKVPAGTCFALVAALAPGDSTIVFSPFSSTVMMATPVVPRRRSTPARSRRPGRARGARPCRCRHRRSCR